MPLLEGPDCRLWVEAAGSGTPVTVVAHGITSSAEEVAPFAAHTPGTRVLFDFRGHGRSESPPVEAGYDHAAMRRDLEFVADRFGATHAFGVSIGAGALMNLLADRPDRFERLVFFIPASIDTPNPAAVPGYPILAQLLESCSLEEVAELVLAAPESQPLFSKRPQWRERVRERILRMNAAGVPRGLRAFVDGPPPLTDGAVLRRVTARALILAHEGDPVHDAAIARRLGDLLPNAEVRIWGEPLEMLDDPVAFSRLVGEFLVGEFLGGGAPRR